MVIVMSMFSGHNNRLTKEGVKNSNTSSHLKRKTKRNKAKWVNKIAN